VATNGNYAANDEKRSIRNTAVDQLPRKPPLKCDCFGQKIWFNLKMLIKVAKIFG
jgi:hypothetical protein